MSQQRLQVQHLQTTQYRAGEVKNSAKGVSTIRMVCISGTSAGRTGERGKSGLFGRRASGLASCSSGSPGCFLIWQARRANGISSRQIVEEAFNVWCMSRGCVSRILGKKQAIAAQTFPNHQSSSFSAGGSPLLIDVNAQRPCALKCAPHPTRSSVHQTSLVCKQHRPLHTPPNT